MIDFLSVSRIEEKDNFWGNLFTSNIFLQAEAQTNPLPQLTNYTYDRTKVAAIWRRKCFSRVVRAPLEGPIARREKALEIGEDIKLPPFLPKIDGESQTLISISDPGKEGEEI